MADKSGSNLSDWSPTTPLISILILFAGCRVCACNGLGQEAMAGLTGVNIADKLILRSGIKKAGFASPVVAGKRCRESVLEGGEDVCDHGAVGRRRASEHRVDCS